jgi:hypothetical protein
MGRAGRAATCWIHIGNSCQLSVLSCQYNWKILVGTPKKLIFDALDGKLFIAVLVDVNRYYAGPKGGSTMKDPTTIQEIVQRLEKLTLGQQRQVLDFTLELSGESSRGISGKELLEFAAGLFPPEDIQQIKQAIEEDCGHVNASEWQKQYTHT